MSVTDLADAADVTKSLISAIENRRILLPGAGKRRRIADALGVRHIDLLVAAGEVYEDEAPASSYPEPLFPANDWRNDLVSQLRYIRPTEERRILLFNLITSMADFDQERNVSPAFPSGIPQN